MKNYKLLENERLDDLEFNDLHVIQDKSGYCFTSDSVLLANIARVKKTDKVVDLGTGSGVIAILIAGKNPGCKVVGVELQTRLSEMATRSVIGNELDNYVEIKNQDIRTFASDNVGKFDVVVSNPPYDYAINKESYTEIEICKSEAMIKVDEVVESAGKLLKYGGLFYMINKSRRLADVIVSMRNNNIEPKKIHFIQPKIGKEIDTFVVEGKKGGKPSLVIPEPIIVYDENGDYNDFCRRLYNK